MKKFTARHIKILLVICLLTVTLPIYTAIFLRYIFHQLVSTRYVQPITTKSVNVTSPTLVSLTLPSLSRENEILSTITVTTQTRDFRQMHYAWSVGIESRRVLFDLATKLAFVCYLRNVTYFMYGGSLLGSYRHHNIIPWDDDIDVFVNNSQRQILEESLATLSPRYTVIKTGPRSKFYSSRSIRKTKYPWKWPYIDINFFTENATHITDASEEFYRYVYPKSVTFPLHARPLGDIYMNSPFDAYATLKLTYNNLNECMTNSYSHKDEQIKSDDINIVACDVLQRVVPFVHRSPNSDGVRETLMIGNTVIHSIVLKEPRYAVVTPFTLALVPPGDSFIGVIS